MPSSGALSSAVSDEDVYMAFLDGEMVACSGLFEVCKGPQISGSIVDTTTLELAATRVDGTAGRLRPHTLQDVMIALRTVGAVLARNPSAAKPLCIVSAVLKDNQRSAKAMSRMELRPIASCPLWLTFEGQTWLSEKGVDYFWVTPDSIRRHAALLLELVEGIGLRQGDDADGVTLDLDLDIQWLRLLPEAISELADGVSIAPLMDVPTLRRVSTGLV